MSRRDLPRHLRALLILSALNYKYGPQGWHIFASDKGRLWAVTTSRPAIDYKHGMITVGCPDAITAGTPAELAAKLRARSAQ